MKRYEDNSRATDSKLSSNSRDRDRYRESEREREKEREYKRERSREREHSEAKDRDNKERKRGDNKERERSSFSSFNQPNISSTSKQNHSYNNSTSSSSSWGSSNQPGWGISNSNSSSSSNSGNSNQSNWGTSSNPSSLSQTYSLDNQNGKQFKPYKEPELGSEEYYSLFLPKFQYSVLPNKKRERSPSPPYHHNSKVRAIENHSFSSARMNQRGEPVVDLNSDFWTTAEEVLFEKSETSKIDFDRYDEIPVETSGNDCPPPINSFIEAYLGDAIQTNVLKAKYERPTPVQKYGIPIVMKGRDLMACAQTGSGKTAAFLLPILSKLLKTQKYPIPHKICCPMVLILAPTRELACQINDEARKFAYRTSLSCAVVFGGIPIIAHFELMERGCDVLVATPGRLVDLHTRGKVSLSRVKYLVLDEADRMLDMGFEPQIRKIVETLDMPNKSNRQTMMFSATFPIEIQRLAASFLNDYIFLTIGRVGAITELISQKFIETDEHKKDGLLLELLKALEGSLILVFVETKKRAEALNELLSNNRFRVTCIHGDRSQRDRTAAIKSFFFR